MSFKEDRSSRFSSGAYELPNHKFSSRFTVPSMCFICGAGLKSDQKAVGYLQNISSTISPTGISCHVFRMNFCCSSQCSELDKLLANFLPQQPAQPAMNAAQRGGSYLILVKLISSSSVTKVCGIFNRRFLLPSSGVQPRSVAKLYIVMGVLEISLLNNLREGIPHLPRVFLFIKPTTLRRKIEPA